MDQITDTTIAEIEQALAEDGVWVDPGFARAFDVSEADEARLVDAVARITEADVQVVLVEVPLDDDRFTGFSSLSAWLQDDLGGDATWIGVDRYDGQLVVDAYGAQPDPTDVGNVAVREESDVVDQVVRATELLQSGEATALWESIPLDERYPDAEDAEADGGLGILTALLLAAGAAAGAAVAVALVSRRRRGRAGRGRGFTLPTTVLHTVRAAEDRRLRARAEAEVLALGEAIGRDEPDGGAPALEAWQQALDHYAAARSILAQASRPADVVGALVLARRGESARAAADRDSRTPWQPPLPCWFNPLHEGPTSEVTWREGARAVDVPACGACAGAVGAGREPEDVLDVIEGDRTVHYFHLDLGAWTRTGYGALDPDLLAALRSPGRHGS